MNPQTNIQQTINFYYAAAIYAALGLAGSAMSILVGAAAVYCIFRFVQRGFPIDLRGLPIWFALAGLVYWASGATMHLLNDDAENMPLIWERLIFLAPLPIVAQLALSPAEDLAKALRIGALIGSLLVAAWAVYALLALKGRVEGGSGNAGPFATSCAVLFSILIASIPAGNSREKWVYGFGALCAGFALGASQMRTLLPILFLMPFLVVIASPSIRQALFRPRVFWPLLFGLLLLSFGVFELFYPRFAELGRNIAASGFSPNPDNSLGQRILMWNCAGESIPDHLLMGMGRSDARDFITTCAASLSGKEIGFSHYHNAVLNALMFGGIPELIAVIALLSTPWLSIRYRERDAFSHFALLTMTGVSLTYLANGTLNLLFGHDIHDYLYVHVMALLIAILIAPRRRTDA